MRQGEFLGDYEILTKPTNANGGKCVWAFAAKDGQEFFIKQFLDPKWPLDTSPGSVASKKLRRQDCLAFEQRHQHVMERLRADAVGGGNIVVAEAFFRDGATYYKVTKRIDASNLDSLTALTVHQKGVVLRTLGLSIQQLHRIDIVHGDLKPDNVLVQKRPGKDLYTAKLIDFDDSYLAGQPPEPETVGGDNHYGAPEWIAYIQEEGHSDGTELTTSVDMFALGLMLHEYLAGQLPGYPPGSGSPGEAVRAGRTLTPDPQLHPDITRLFLALTDARPQRRPSVEEFLDAIEDETKLDLFRPWPAVPPPAAAMPAGPAAGGGRRVKFNFGDGGGGKPSRDPDAGGSPKPPAREEESAAPSSRTSRVRIHLDSETPSRASNGHRPPGI